MNYLKKICIFKEISSGYTYNGKPLSGMLKCEKVNSTITLSLSVCGLAPNKKGSYFLVVGKASLFEVFEIDCGDYSTKIYEDIIDITSPFCAGIIIAQENKVLCYASTPDYKGKSQDVLDFFNAKRLAISNEQDLLEKEIENALRGEQEASTYEDDTLATENYYENADVDLKNLSVKELNDIKANQNEAFDKQNFKQEKTKDFKNDPCIYDEDSCECFTAIEDVENVLSCFPRYKDLEQAVYGSVWVTVPLDKGEYYFGKAQIGEEKYLCYAVKGQRDECPEELKALACFIPCAPFKPDEGYFVMFQDADSGKVIKK